MVRSVVLLLSAFGLSACSSDQIVRNPAQGSHDTEKPFTKNYPIPNEYGFTGWHKNPTYQVIDRNLNKMPRVSVECEDKKLYPTHPAMNLKEYYIFLKGRYDHFKLFGNFDNKKEDGKDEACIISAPRGSKKNSNGRLNCVSAHSIEYTVLSDTYMDRCGNYYRGLSEQQYFPTENRMQDMWSVGRWTFADPKSEFQGSKVVEVIAGHTYPTAENQFLFLTPLFEGDMKAINESKENALKYTHTYDAEKMTFEVKDSLK
ncbi:MAG: hypothetical protein AB7H97_14235 [Pseudobdellovibrionaceae bacterium]